MKKLKAVTKELLSRWQDRIAWVMAHTFLNEDNPAVAAARKKRARWDYDFFVREYFPHIARSKNAKFQTAGANKVLKNPLLRALFKWFRGCAKSTHFTVFMPMWLKIQEPREINVMVLVSKSQESAIGLLSDLQAELQYNEKYKKDFGEQVKSGDWTEGKFRTLDGCMFVALGRGQSPRGLKDRSKRPDYIIIDDIDDDEIINNSKRIGKIFDWCLTALFGTMEGGRGRFIMVGNQIGKDSVLSRFEKSKGVEVMTVNILDKSGNSSWPDNYSLGEIQSMRDFMGERRFQKEYMNNPINEGTIFLEKHIRYGKMLDLKFYKQLICYTDPSFKDSSTSDYKATMLLGKAPTGEYHLIKAYADQTSASMMVQWHYDINEFVAGRVPVMYYMESNFLQDLILDEFKRVGQELAFHIPIRGDARKKPDKFSRIEAMQPLFERGLIIINEKEKDSHGVKILVEQLLMFERGSRINDDAPDALEGGIFLLNRRTQTTSGTGYAFGARPSRKY
jgi:predicted phage terminase large subunit-like protein